MLDNLDLRILELLVKNPRITVSEIARELNISRQTTRQRIEKINRSGIIKGFFPVFNTEKLGGILVLIMFASETRVTEKLSQAMVWEIYLTTNSNPNTIVLGRIFSLEDLKKLVSLMEQIDPKAEIRIVSSIETNFDAKDAIVASGLSNITCETCGEKIRGKPYTYTYRNTTHYFCCPVCRDTFIKKLRSERND
jgi:DNA-binding Lrp family transcriptional regulator